MDTLDNDTTNLIGGVKRGCAFSTREDPVDSGRYLELW